MNRLSGYPGGRFVNLSVLHITFLGEFWRNFRHPVPVLQHVNPFVERGIQLRDALIEATRFKEDKPDGVSHLLFIFLGIPVMHEAPLRQLSRCSLNSAKRISRLRHRLRCQLCMVFGSFSPAKRISWTWRPLRCSLIRFLGCFSAAKPILRLCDRLRCGFHLVFGHF